MEKSTSYAGENTRINCNVKYAIRWTSLAIRTRSSWMPLEVRLYSNGTVYWSRLRTKRHDVMYDFHDIDGLGTYINMDLMIDDVNCEDSQAFLCILESDITRGVKQNRLMVVGKPSNHIKLVLGPSIIESKALRLTATWSAGYPDPWTEFSWIATDIKNNTFNLEEFGQYKEVNIDKDSQQCETTLTNSFVIYPTLDLNDTVVTVQPNLMKTRYFVDADMKELLANVKSGREQIQVIPLDYCGDIMVEKAMQHPYTTCTKYIRCLPGDITVQQCPGGTCYTGGRECS